MNKRPIVALMYDFDKTLSPLNMQEYTFIPGLGMQAEEFWELCNRRAREYGMDEILAYMMTMLQEVKGKMLLTRSVLNDLGRSVELFPGVESWFERINQYGAQLGVEVEHYIISCGLKEIIEGTGIARHFKQIYAAEYCYDERGVPFWPALAVNYTGKQQFLYRINKGVFDVTEHEALNRYTPPGQHRVPFTNMVYVGDGLTDVPCMKLVRVYGGHSIAVYRGSRELADSLARHGRVDFTAPADYSPGSKMECCVRLVMDKIAAAQRVTEMHLADLSECT